MSNDKKDNSETLEKKESKNSLSSEKKETKSVSSKTKSTKKSTVKAKETSSSTETLNSSKPSDYGVIELGGKQYIVEPGTIVSVEKIEAGKDNILTIDKLLLHSASGKLTIGTPFIENQIVKAELLSTEKDKKIRVFKFKKKTGYKKTRGHRQELSTIKILSFENKTKGDK